eukprot:sb/3478873/
MCTGILLFVPAAHTHWPGGANSYPTCAWAAVTLGQGSVREPTTIARGLGLPGIVWYVSPSCVFRLSGQCSDHSSRARIGSGQCSDSVSVCCQLSVVT